VWNFRHNNRTSRQEGWFISLEKHATTSILLTSEMHLWKFEVNIAGDQWSVNSFAYCFTAYAQSVLLLVECMTWSPSQWSSGQTSAILQPDVSWGDWCHECVRDTLAAPARSTRDSPPDSDQGCLVAITMVVWNPVSLEKVKQLFLVLGVPEHCPTGIWRVSDVNITVISEWPFAVCTGI